MSYPLEKYRFYTDGIRKIVAVSTYAGRTCRGVSVCHPDDTFDIELGKKIAAARCNLVVAEKRMKRAKLKKEAAQTALDAAQRNMLKETTYYDDACDARVEAENELNTLMENIRKI